jgi:hypothetical protein
MFIHFLNPDHFGDGRDFVYPALLERVHSFGMNYLIDNQG